MPDDNSAVGFKIDQTFYENNSSLDLGIFAQYFSPKQKIEIFNLGAKNLVIQSILFEDYSYANQSILQNLSTPSTISVGNKITFDISLDTLQLGTNFLLLAINSDDEIIPKFIIKLSYTIKLQYDLIVKFDGEQKNNLETINLGSIPQLDDTTRTLRITNAGVGKQIKILDIGVENNLILLNPKSLPYILDTYERNAYQVSMQLNTITKGKKTGNFNIQWEVVN